MIRTLLVDDEPIVRKGLIHIMPWEKYGFRITADVDNAQKALDLLTRERFDLLVTDLTMPGMNGFQFIQETKKKYPDLSIVILTCHQDFQYVQEALRLGALDYIVKTELEEEKLDRIFERISEALKNKAANMKKGEGALTQNGVLFIGLHESCSRQELYSLPWMKGRGIQPVTDCAGSWYVETDLNEAEEESLRLTQADSLKEKWIVVRLYQVVHRETLLPRFIKRHAFYSFSTSKPNGIFHESLHELLKLEEIQDNKEWQSIWKKYDWIFQERAWQHLVETIETSRPSPLELAKEIYNTVSSWKGMRLFDGLAAFGEEALSLVVWQEWKDWLWRLRRKLQEAMSRRRADEDNAGRVLQAIHFVNERLGDGITQEEAASAVHLSRGYFSDCFKRAAGCTFNEFMKQLRLDSAARLLVTTEHDLQDIAQLCGFSDEFYFRKLFKDLFGRTPKDFRLQGSFKRSSYTLSILGVNAREKIVSPDLTTVRCKQEG